MSELQKNEAQEQAINATEGPVIIISCPGSGKTTTLVRRIENIINKGCDPKKILMVTFSKASAVDMEERYVEMFNKNPGIRFSTIHSLCLTILAQAGKYNQRDIMSERDKMEFFLKRVYDVPKMTDNVSFANIVMTEISYVKNNHINIQSKTYKPNGIDKNVLLELFNEYEKEKQATGKIDFDDMLLKCEELLEEDESVLKKWQNKYDYIQCDEYQDTNLCQKNILYMLADNNKNLCVVGDDDQSIYGFRGADFEIMLNFPNDFKDATVISMSTNYRSAQSVIDKADTLIKRNQNRFEKDFKSFRGEFKNVEGSVEFEHFESDPEMSRAITNKIIELNKEGISYNDMAVLFRNNKQAVVPIITLLREEIPIKTAENVKTIYDSSIFYDIKSYVELSLGIEVNKNLMDILNRPNRFLKKSAFKNVTEFTYPNMINSIEYLLSKPAWQYGNAEESIRKWMAHLGPNKINWDSDPTDLLDKIFNSKKIAYLKYVEELAEFTNTPVEESYSVIEELYNDASKFSTIREWFNYANSIQEKIKKVNRESRNKSGVNLLTMHKSKGLEYKVVFVVGVNEGILPSPRSKTDKDIEEERRLMYVAMTRAKDQLYIYSYGDPSRFVEEIKSGPEKKDVSKKLKGTKVNHKDFGKGKVVKYADGEVIINFNMFGIKRLKFPETFEDGVMEYI